MLCPSNSILQLRKVAAKKHDRKRGVELDMSHLPLIYATAYGALHEFASSSLPKQQVTSLTRRYV